MTPICKNAVPALTIMRKENSTDRPAAINEIKMIHSSSLHTVQRHMTPSRHNSNIISERRTLRPCLLACPVSDFTQTGRQIATSGHCSVPRNFFWNLIYNKLAKLSEFFAQISSAWHSNHYFAMNGNLTIDSEWYSTFWRNSNLRNETVSVVWYQVRQFYVRQFVNCELYLEYSCAQKVNKLFPKMIFIHSKK